MSSDLENLILHGTRIPARKQEPVSSEQRHWHMHDEGQHRFGIGRRRVYYRDTEGRYEELATCKGRFAGIRPRTASEQASLAAVADPDR